MELITVAHWITILAPIGLILSISTLVYGQQITHVLFAPRFSGTQDRYVAEVWLEGEICRGSTLYRQRFLSERMARIHAKLHAFMLDFCLPKYYLVEDEWGKLRPRRFDCDIRFGCRQLTASEADTFAPLWSTVMPGYDGFKGEYREAHPPLSKQLEVAGEWAGLKV
jgi:hypothetical protein